MRYFSFAALSVAVGTLMTISNALGAPTVLSSVPPDGAIDGRRIYELRSTAFAAGWQSVTIAFDTDATNVAWQDFSIRATSGTAPMITAAVVDGSEVELLFDRPIPAGAWTIVTHEPTGAAVRLGCLPGDVDGSGYAGPADLLRLVDAVNGEGQPLPVWSADIDRSGGVDGADIAMLKALLSGQGDNGGWLGHALPGTMDGFALEGAPHYASGSIASLGSAVIELAPGSTTMPLGGSVTVEVFITQTGGPDPILSRMIQLDFTTSGPGLALSPPGTSGTIVEMFDFGSATGCPGTCGTAHLINSVFPVVSAAYGDATHLLPDGSLQMNLIDGVQTKIAEIIVQGVVPGTYALNALNAGGPGADDGAQLFFGFGTGVDGIPITNWKATNGDLTGGALMLEVGECGSDLDCDDSVPCTFDTCVDGFCVFLPDDTVELDDGLYCNGFEGYCQGGTIEGTLPPPNCDDGVECTSDDCDDELDVCVHEVVAGFCHIGPACLADGSVNPAESCQLCLSDVDPMGWSAQPDSTTCLNGVFCDGAETCVSGACQPGTPPDCDDGLDCTSDSCDLISDSCRYDPEDQACDDGQFCNGVETCEPSAGCLAGDDPCPPDSACDEQSDACEQGVIPTVSTWGLAVLTLLLLAWAKVSFGRRRTI